MNKQHFRSIQNPYSQPNSYKGNQTKMKQVEMLKVLQKEQTQQSKSPSKLSKNFVLPQPQFNNNSSKFPITKIVKHPTTTTDKLSSDTRQIIQDSELIISNLRNISQQYSTANNKLYFPNTTFIPSHKQLVLPKQYNSPIQNNDQYEQQQYAKPQSTKNNVFIQPNTTQIKTENDNQSYLFSTNQQDNLKKIDQFINENFQIAATMTTTTNSHHQQAKDQQNLKIDASSISQINLEKRVETLERELSYYKLQKPQETLNCQQKLIESQQQVELLKEKNRLLNIELEDKMRQFIQIDKYCAQIENQAPQNVNLQAQIYKMSDQLIEKDQWICKLQQEIEKLQRIIVDLNYQQQIIYDNRHNLGQFIPHAAQRISLPNFNLHSPVSYTKKQSEPQFTAEALQTTPQQTFINNEPYKIDDEYEEDQSIQRKRIFEDPPKNKQNTTAMKFKQKFITDDTFRATNLYQQQEEAMRDFTRYQFTNNYQ